MSCGRIRALTHSVRHLGSSLVPTSGSSLNRQLQKPHACGAGSACRVKGVVMRVAIDACVSSAAMLRRRFVSLLSIALASGLLIAPAEAASTTYSTHAAFDAATTSPTTRTFDGLTGPNGAEHQCLGGCFTLYPGGLTVGGVTFRSIAGNRLLAMDPQFNYPGYYFPSGDFLNDNTSGPSNTLVTFASPVHAWGADLSSINQTGVNVVLTLSTGETFTFSQPGKPNFVFFGVTSPTP